MKKLIALTVFSALSTTTAFAHPGGSKLVCKSAANSGSKQKLELTLARSNGVGWAAPVIEVTADKKKYLLTTPDDMQNYGLTFHNSPLKVITVTADVPAEEKTIGGILSVVAIPSTVKAFDYEGQAVKWSLEAEKDSCYDVAGKALFQGIIKGVIIENDDRVEIDAQVLDCELKYDSGMSC